MVTPVLTLTLQDALHDKSVKAADAEILALEWPAANVGEFLAGLEWVTLCYLEQRKPALSMPTAVPWRELATEMAAAAAGDIESAMMTVIAQYPPMTQSALVQAVTARSDSIQAQRVQSAAAKRRVDSAELERILSAGGYSFRQNVLTDRIEVNGAPMTTERRNQLRVYLRDLGYGKESLEYAEEVWSCEAARNSYHPVRAWLDDLAYDGGDHIATLASYFTDRDGHFRTLLRKWLIGSVARAFTGCQNPVLTLEGAQELGKSQFARWLSPSPAFFCESGVDPDSKDHMIRACTKFVWEISELGSTTLRRDREQLKFFLSSESHTYRLPYGRFEVDKPALANFIATANNSGGLLDDSTGSRRFWLVALTHIDWNYAVDCDCRSVWAEAHAAYRAGEEFRLSADERLEVVKVNEKFEIPDPVGDMLRKIFVIDPDERWWLCSADILSELRRHGATGPDKALSMAVASSLKRMKLEKDRVGNVNGFYGIKPV